MKRLIDPEQTFKYLVDWLHNEVIVRQGAPGFMVGLSGTDSIVTFLACYEAFKKAGRPERVRGVHFAPSRDFLDDHPEAKTHLWFCSQALPWVEEKCKGAWCVVDTSIDWRYDGLRWGMLADMSVISNKPYRWLREPEEQFWVVGTRNKTEDTLKNYSNASTIVSLQPIIHLWKSEILQIAEYLKVPEIVLTKSCEADCICGRERIPARHPFELDTLLMDRLGQLSSDYAAEINSNLRIQLQAYIDVQLTKNSFKSNIPYLPSQTNYRMDNGVVQDFESGMVQLSTFNHYRHLYIAWYYLKTLPYAVALYRYTYHLVALLKIHDQSARFNADMTRTYFEKLKDAIKRHPAKDLDGLLAVCPELTRSP